MAKCSTIILASALCLLSLIDCAYSEEKGKLDVEGLVYCDSCRIQVQTRIDKPIEGAEVKLQCKNLENEKITYTQTAKTNKEGKYSIKVEGDHEEEECEVVLVSSPDPKCNIISHDLHLQTSAQISLTSDNGIAGPVRLPNPLGFMTKEAAPECAEVLKELGLTPDGRVASSH